MNKKNILLVIIIAAIAAGIYFRQFFSIELFERYVKDAGITGILLFIGIYILATVLFLPGMVLTTAGGALYGPLTGTLINLTGATLGATASFMIARYFAGAWVEKKTTGRLQALKIGIEAEDWRFVAFTRLVPLFPFNLLNYALGLTKISAFRYILCTFIFMIPGAGAYTYLGYLGKAAAKGEEGLLQKILLGIALLALIFFIPRITGYFRRGKTVTISELGKMLRENNIDLLLDVRGENEYKTDPGHIQGAVNIPDSAVKNNPEQLEGFREKKIVVICRTDKRSTAIAQFLSQKGFGDVHIATGGMVAWQKSGFPVKQG